MSIDCETFETHWASCAFSKCDLCDCACVAGGFRCLSTADPATCGQGDCVSRKTRGSKGIKTSAHGDRRFDMFDKMFDKI